MDHDPSSCDACLCTIQMALDPSGRFRSTPTVSSHVPCFLGLYSAIREPA